MSQTGREKLAAARAGISGNSVSRMTSGYGPPPPRAPVPSPTLSRTNSLSNFDIPFSLPEAKTSPVNTTRTNTPPVNTPRVNSSSSPVNTSRKNCRTFNPRRSGSAVYRKTGKPTFNSVSVCGPKPCPIPGQIRSASGCICPPGQEEVDGACLSFCPSDRKRVGRDCVCNEGFIPDKTGKCYKKVECKSPETPNADFTFCECKPPYTRTATGKCEGVSKCVYPMTLNTQTNQCECKGPGAVEIKGKCEVVAKCGPDEILNATNKCECKPGFTKDNLGKCCDLSKNEIINGECLPKCSANEDRVGKVCVPRPPPMDTTKPISITTDVVLGGFQQSTSSRTSIRQDAIDSTVIIDIPNHKIKIGEYILSGIPYPVEFTSRVTGNKYKRKVNGVGIYQDNIWALYIKNISFRTEKIGIVDKHGISIEFHLVNGNNEISNKGLNGQALKYGAPTPVFIVTDGLTSYVQNGKNVTTKPEVMTEILREALLPPKSGGRRKTTNRKHRHTRKSRKNNRKSRKQEKKTKKNRRK